MLAVDGEVIVEGLVCQFSGDWADFVFDENYKLMSLDKLESFVREKKHLPGISSAKELQEKGLDFEDIITRQHQKIEELTLYLIQLKKEIDSIKSKIK